MNHLQDQARCKYTLDAHEGSKQKSDKILLLANQAPFNCVGGL